MATIRKRAAALALQLCAAALLVVSATQVAAAQSSATQAWPQRPVRFIVPLGPGAGVDIAARLYAERLSQRWGQPVVVENRPGGDSIVAITAFLSGDDHTLLFSPSAAFTAHPFQHEKLPYAAEDLVPIARISNTLVVAGVPKDLPANSLRELVALAKEKPGTMNWAGVTGALDFVTESFLRDAGADIRKVPYRDAVQALNDLTEGRIQLYTGALAIMRPQVQAGRVKLLAITNGERAPGYPDVPTAVDAGYPSLDFDGLVGLFGQRSMPAERRAKIAADVQAVGNDPLIKERLEATGQLARTSGAEEFAASIDKQRGQVAAAAERVGAKRMAPAR